MISNRSDCIVSGLTNAKHGQPCSIDNSWQGLSRHHRNLIRPKTKTHKHANVNKEAFQENFQFVLLAFSFSEKGRDLIYGYRIQLIPILKHEQLDSWKHQSSAEQHEWTCVWMGIKEITVLRRVPWNPSDIRAFELRYHLRPASGSESLFAASGALETWNMKQARLGKVRWKKGNSTSRYDIRLAWKRLGATSWHGRLIGTS